ncbi:MAG: hypothetical protein KA383_11225 [Phycisphaerae bacterium]|nr:hypothetical protein [Phycisphaerae bacterium]
MDVPWCSGVWVRVSVVPSLETGAGVTRPSRDLQRGGVAERHAANVRTVLILPCNDANGALSGDEIFVEVVGRSRGPERDAAQPCGAPRLQVYWESQRAWPDHVGAETGGRLTQPERVIKTPPPLGCGAALEVPELSELTTQKAARNLIAKPRGSA